MAGVWELGVGIGVEFHHPEGETGEVVRSFTPRSPTPISFLYKMMENELQLLLVNPNSVLKPSDIAILTDFAVPFDLIPKFLQEKFGLHTQTVADFFTTNNEDAIIMDEAKKLVSFEIPCVIFVHSNPRINYHNHDMYLIASRARTRLTIIDYEHTDVGRPPFIDKNVSLVKWKESNGGFVISTS